MDQTESEIAIAVQRLADVQEQSRYAALFAASADPNSEIGVGYAADLARLRTERATLVATLATLCRCDAASGVAA